MNEINYLILNKRDAKEWQKNHPADDQVPLSNIYNHRWSQYKDDDLVAIIATEKDKIIGMISLGYCDIFVNGEIKRFLISGGFYVLEEYRNQSVGIRILGKILKLDMPYIASGLSGPMSGILDNWRSFHKVDVSSVFGVGTSFFGTVRLGRLALNKQFEQNKSLNPLQVFLTLAKQWLIRLRLLNSPVTALGHEEAVTRLDEVLSSWQAKIQVPWNRKKLSDSLRNDPHGNDYSWMVSHNISGTEKLNLISINLRKVEASVMNTRDIRVLTTARLLEIFPPVEDEQVARDLIAFAYAKAKKLKADILFCFAMTTSLNAACNKMDMYNGFNKSVYVGLNRVETDYHRLIIDPDAWWCRAENEDQFEESIFTSLHQPLPKIAIIE
jgi:hypothetical protein